MSLEARAKFNITADHPRQLESSRCWCLYAIDPVRNGDISHRSRDITLFLNKQNLPFRDNNEDESFNKVKFLEMVEMLSKYDPVLKRVPNEIKQSMSKLKSLVSHLAPTTQNEFIHVLSNHVRGSLSWIKNLQGFWDDSTPDTLHTDQMSHVIRYVKMQYYDVPCSRLR